MKLLTTPFLLLAPLFLSAFAAPTKRDDDIGQYNNYAGLPANVLFMYSERWCANIAASHSLEGGLGKDQVSFSDPVAQASHDFGAAGQSYIRTDARIELRPTVNSFEHARIKAIVWSAEEGMYNFKAWRKLNPELYNDDDNQLREVWLVVCFQRFPLRSRLCTQSRIRSNIPVQHGLMLISTKMAKSERCTARTWRTTGGFLRTSSPGKSLLCKINLVSSFHYTSYYLVPF